LRFFLISEKIARVEGGKLRGEEAKEEGKRFLRKGKEPEEGILGRTNAR
jgi:hypothetical protein